MAPEHQCDINDNLRYPIGKVADLYAVPYKNKTSNCYFYRALQLYHILWSTFKEDKWVKSWMYKMIQKKFGFKLKAFPRPYTIWNCLGLLTAIAMIRGRGHKDIKKWRKYFDWFAKNKWGPAYKIVAGKQYTWQEVDWYKKHRTNHLNIVEQRGPIHRTKPETGTVNSMDYPILKALQKVWG